MKGGIVILAAGSSSRLGFPKQTFKVNHKSLLQNAIDEAQLTSVEDIVVVLGANKETITEHTDLGNACYILNDHWEAGMSTSIICGLVFLEHKLPNLAFVVFLVCDQPYLKAFNIQKIVDEFLSSNAQIVASSYRGINGTPALFDESVFDELRKLKGERGAMSIIKSNKYNVSLVEFPEGIIDVDTDEDIQKLL